ncbi:response regulator [Ferrovibrio sp.]|uniref:response regulator n=1 Tax=Ferrovibrio sp. TaxID=1917215 RepID=UPI0025C61FB7|nr:response regulator [Ferrovibrio sp.]
MAAILVVDDDVLVATTIAIALEDAGHSVVRAVDGVEAYRLFRGRSFDLVIADFRMPFADGASLVDMIRNREYRSRTPVILMSGAVPQQAAVDNLDVQDFLAKPFDDARLTAAVDKVLAPRQATAN